MMGAGKSAVGRCLADLTGREFRDTDRLLSTRLGRPITQLFSIYGEEAFRAHETAILRQLEPGPYVLATGGGMIMREENWTEFRRVGLTIFLNFPTEVIIKRLGASKKKRPLLLRDDWETVVYELYEKRRSHYEKADIHVTPVEGDIGETAQLVLSALQAHGVAK